MAGWGVILVNVAASKVCFLCIAESINLLALGLINQHSLSRW